MSILLAAATLPDAVTGTLTDTLTDTVLSGPFLVAAGLSVAAGAVSFASPCVLPLVPGYLSYLVGLLGAERVQAAAPEAAAGAAASAASLGAGSPGVSAPAAPSRLSGSAGSAGSSPAGRAGLLGGSPSAPGVADARVRSRAVRATALFVAGFTVVFLAQAVAVLGLSRALLANGDVLMRVGGAVTIVMGLVMLGYVKPLQTERRLHRRPTGRVLGAPLLGAVFALGWTVCLGPTLVGVLALAGSTSWGGSAWRGLLLVICYCVGLGLPFLLLAFGFSWASNAAAVLRRHSRAIQIVGAVGLLVLGTLMLTGVWGGFMAWLQGRFAGVGTVL